MKKIIFFTILLLVLTACGSTTDNNADETDNYKVLTGKITNNSLLITLAVRAESIIEQYDEIDNVKVDETDIEAEKQSNMKDNETEEIYENVYYISGQYSWQDKKYNFEWAVSFDENDVDASGKVLQYTSDMMVNQLNVDRTAVE